MSEIENNKIEGKQSRWTSKLMWGAIIVQFIVVADVVGLWQAIGIEKSTFTIVADAVLQLLVIVGVINDPTNKTGW